MKAKYFLIAILFFGNLGFAQNPNFHVYLSFGQSNMEGHSKFEPQDTLVNERFQVLQSVDCPELDREAGKWYTAVPPLSRCDTGLTPTDYFGRTLIQNLPEEIKVGVINVAVGGCKIELFDKENYQDYVDTAPDWMMSKINQYDGNPYGHLVDLGRKAQEKGVIKGILLHQGESNTGDEEWPKKVKAVYDNLIKDLNLNADEVPLIAGEMVSEEQGGKCASMNSILAKLPEEIPNAHIVSSEGCEAVDDGLHFSAAGYRELGERYGEKMLSILNERNKNDNSQKSRTAEKVLKLLFLGHDKELHNSRELLNTIQENFSGEGIKLTYTENPNDIAEKSLNSYDGIMIYANHDSISPQQEKSLKQFVEGGKALIAVHSASFMFRNSDWYVKTVGAQFKSHGQGTFKAEIVKPDHKIMQDFSEFESWDETYEHQKINPDIEVLMERKEENKTEPWTWTRDQGKGRVFYTASGHDDRTWSNPEFQKLLVNGIKWAVNNSGH